jgi:hypothetical protein
MSRVPLIVAPITFILAILSVHRLMIEQAATIKRELNDLGESIDHLGRQLASRADELDPGVAEKKMNSLELMQKPYTSNQDIHLWPLKLGLLNCFATDQKYPFGD